MKENLNETKKEDSIIEDLSLKVTSKIFDIPCLKDLGFVSFVTVQLNSVYFAWGQSFEEQLDRLIENDIKNLFYVVREDGDAELVILNQEYIQINSSCIISSKPSLKESVVERRGRGGTLWKKEMLDEKGVKQFTRQIYELTINNEDCNTIFVQSLWGSK